MLISIAVVVEIHESWRYSEEFRVQLSQWRIGSLRDVRCKRCFSDNVRQLIVLCRLQPCFSLYDLVAVTSFETQH